MEFVIHDISLHYAFGGSNLDLNIDITNALRGDLTFGLKNC